MPTRSRALMVVVGGLDLPAHPTALVELPQWTRPVRAQEHHA